MHDAKLHRLILLTAWIFYGLMNNQFFNLQNKMETTTMSFTLQTKLNSDGKMDCQVIPEVRIDEAAFNEHIPKNFVKSKEAVHMIRETQSIPDSENSDKQQPGKPAEKLNESADEGETEFEDEEEDSDDESEVCEPGRCRHGARTSWPVTGHFLHALTKSGYETSYTDTTLERSLCKLAPEGYDCYELFDTVLTIPMECHWCGSKQHLTRDCLLLAEWTQRTLIATEHWKSTGDPDEQKIKDLLNMSLTDVREKYYPGDWNEEGYPWEFHVDLKDGEYVTRSGVVLIVRNNKLKNVIPRFLQSGASPLAPMPRPAQFETITKLSDVVNEPIHQPAFSGKEILQEIRSIHQELSRQYSEVDKEIKEVKKTITTHGVNIIKTAISDMTNVICGEITNTRVLLMKRPGSSLQDQGSPNKQPKYVGGMMMTPSQDQLDANFKSESWAPHWTWAPENLQRRTAFWRQLNRHFNMACQMNMDHLSRRPVTKDMWPNDLQNTVHLDAAASEDILRSMILTSGCWQWMKNMDKMEFEAFVANVQQQIKQMGCYAPQIYVFAQGINFLFDCYYSDLTQLLKTTVAWLIANITRHFAIKTEAEQRKCLSKHFFNSSTAELNTLLKRIPAIRWRRCDCGNHKGYELSLKPKLTPPFSHQQLKESLVSQWPRPFVTATELQELYTGSMLSYLYASMYGYHTHKDPLTIVEEGKACFGSKMDLTKESFQQLYNNTRSELLDSKSISALELDNAIQSKLIALILAKIDHCPCGYHKKKRSHAVASDTETLLSDETMNFLAELVEHQGILPQTTQKVDGNEEEADSSTTDVDISDNEDADDSDTVPDLISLLDDTNEEETTPKDQTSNTESDSEAEAEGHPNTPLDSVVMKPSTLDPIALPWTPSCTQGNKDKSPFDQSFKEALRDQRSDTSDSSSHSEESDGGEKTKPTTLTDTPSLAPNQDPTGDHHFPKPHTSTDASFEKAPTYYLSGAMFDKLSSRSSPDLKPAFTTRAGLCNQVKLYYHDKLFLIMCKEDISFPQTTEDLNNAFVAPFALAAYTAPECRALLKQLRDLGPGFILYWLTDIWEQHHRLQRLFTAAVCKHRRALKDWIVYTTPDGSVEYCDKHCSAPTNGTTTDATNTTDSTTDQDDTTTL